MLVVILLFMPRAITPDVCFIGFAIGESLGAAALRIAGGIFTKIADIGSDLMKIVFKIKEDDARNPGVIADCTGDNAGDSVGPTADGFETYGVTGVALISFICLAVPDTMVQAKLIVWIFAMRFLMDFMSGVSYFVNQAISENKYKGLKEFDFEEPLTRLIWIASILCITTSFGMSWLLIGDMADGLWWKLASIISCGTLAAVLIPEFTKVFTSSHSKHVHEIVTASREGGASLTILSGLVAGNFSAFWKGILIAALMGVAYYVSLQGVGEVLLGEKARYASVFAFGLVAFGFLCMGPVNIAVDSYGPVTDNAQSIFELARTEQIPGIREEIQRDFGFTPDFEQGKHYLEANDSAGNTFKATAKPVLIGTAVVGATTMIFSIILILEKTILKGSQVSMLQVSLTDAPVLLGLICGGAVIYWVLRRLDAGRHHRRLPGRRVHQAEHGPHQDGGRHQRLADRRADLHRVRPGGHVEHLHRPDVLHARLRAVRPEFLRRLPDVDRRVRPVPGDLHGQRGRLVGQRQEVRRGRPQGEEHAAARGDGGRRHGRRPVQGHDLGGAEPIIKFSTLFGLLAVEIAISIKVEVADKLSRKESAFDYTAYVGGVLLLVALVFVWRSFYAMRIPKK